MFVTKGIKSKTSVFLKLKKNVNFLSTLVDDNHPNVLKSDAKDVEIKDVTIHELIYSKIEPYFKYICTESPINGKSYTFEQIRVNSRNLSKNLRQKFKLKGGDVIALFLPNLPEYVICFLGSLEARLILTTMNHMYTAEEISKQMIDASPKIIITTPSQLSTLKGALNISKMKLPIIVIKERQDESLPENTIDFFELINNVIDIPDIQPGKSTDVALMPYSSGTTGLPKGVELMHRNLVANVCQIDCPDFNFFRTISDDFQDIAPGVLPFYHIYGMTLNVLFMYHGTRCVVLKKFHPDLYISVLQNYTCTAIFGAPPLVHFLTTHPGVKPEYFKNLRFLSSGAAPLGFADEERFLKKIGRSDATVMQGYGLTETSPVLTQNPTYSKRSQKNSGSVGKLLPNTMMKIINVDDPQGTPLGTGVRGELLVKGPQVMKGYHNKPEETKNTFLNGWLRTGDIGYYNDEKFIFITDRLKELIKVKGFQVAPAELEEILRDYPSVADAAVIGIPHPHHGEVPRAYVVPKKDASVNVDELNKFVTEKVASYKKLDGGIEVVNSIPRNPSGKILRRTLKEDYKAKFV